MRLTSTVCHIKVGRRVRVSVSQPLGSRSPELNSGSKLGLYRLQLVDDVWERGFRDRAYRVQGGAVVLNLLGSPAQGNPTRQDERLST